MSDLFCQSNSDCGLCHGQKARSLQGSLIQEVGSFRQHMPSPLLTTFTFHCGDVVRNSNTTWTMSLNMSGAIIHCTCVAFCHISKASVAFYPSLCLQSIFGAIIKKKSHFDAACVKGQIMLIRGIYNSSKGGRCLNSTANIPLFSIALFWKCFVILHLFFPNNSDKKNKNLHIMWCVCVWS